MSPAAQISKLIIVPVLIDHTASTKCTCVLYQWTLISSIKIKIRDNNFASAIKAGMFSASSFWLDGCEDTRREWRTSTLPTQTDTVVIGAGITGASAAYHLSSHGIECVLLDRRVICGGATGRNGGFLTPGIADSTANSVRMHGEETTRKLYAYTIKGTDAIETFVATHSIDCELRFDGEAILAVTEAEEVSLRSAYETSRDICGVDFDWWDKDTCAERTKSSRYVAGVFKHRCGNLWPAKLVSGVVRCAVAQGACVQSHTEVLSVRSHESGDGCVVVTNRGEIFCRHVVHATNAWANELIPALTGIITPVRNQVIITAPVPQIWKFGLCANHGFEYFMQRPDGRLVLGGMRNLTEGAEWNCKDDEGNPTAVVSESLRHYFQTHFPDLTSVVVEQEWAGIMGFSKDRNPLIGPLRGRPGEYIAAGFSGHGMPYTFLAGQNIADFIRGVEPDGYVESAFSPARFGI